jgi:LysM repeat protein
VEAGDSPAKIAQKYGVKVEDLMKVNNITDPRRLRVGQELVIPDSSDGAAATPTPAPHG